MAKGSVWVIRLIERASRLLPQTFTGTLFRSNEIEGLELNAGRFTAYSPMGDTARAPNRRKSIDVMGGSYTFIDYVIAPT